MRLSHFSKPTSKWRHISRASTVSLAHSSPCGFPLVLSSQPFSLLAELGTACLLSFRAFTRASPLPLLCPSPRHSQAHNHVCLVSPSGLQHPPDLPLTLPCFFLHSAYHCSIKYTLVCSSDYPCLNGSFLKARIFVFFNFVSPAPREVLGT